MPDLATLQGRVAQCVTRLSAVEAQGYLLAGEEQGAIASALQTLWWTEDAAEAAEWALRGEESDLRAVRGYMFTPCRSEKHPWYCTDLDDAPESQGF